MSRVAFAVLAALGITEAYTQAAGGIDASKLPPAATRAVDFQEDIRPIFEQHCVKCHGSEKQKGGWRADTKDIALKGGDNYAPNVVAGKSAESPLIHMVTGLEADMKMPAKGEPLTSEQIGLLRAWIDQGARWPESGTTSDPLDWWSFKPVRRLTVPGGADLKADINPIDAFVQAKLADKQLTPSAEADRRTLIRRVYFDLTGLPPTPEEIDAFVADPDPHAYAKAVDRLLASLHYGERWARHWLDVVHYGDTHGYDKDKPRPDAWPYRDYVIRALNEDKPYARFVQEQIAGDVLFPGTRDGIEALGFIAAGPWDLIGHTEVPETKIDGKITRHLDRDDMVANTIGTFCSVTVHCAQCHNHKFDPISQDDYYALHAVFAALDRTSVRYYADEKLNLRFRELQNRRKETATALAAIEDQLKEKAGAQLVTLDQRIERTATDGVSNTAPEFGYHSAISPRQESTKWVQVDLGSRVDISRVVLVPSYDDFNGIGAGFGFPIRFKIETSDDPEFKVNVKLLSQRHDETFTNDLPNPGLREFEIDALPETQTSGRYVRVTAVRLAPRKDDFIFALAELRVFDRGGRNVAERQPVTAHDSIEAPPRWRTTNLTDGIVPVSAVKESKQQLIAARESLLVSLADEATRARRNDLIARSQRIVEELKKLGPPQQVYAGSIHHGSGAFRGTGPDEGKPRPIFLLARGQVTQPRKEVRAGALSSLTFQPARFTLDPNDPEGERRAALARWITDLNNPLTWRSIVNRVWQYHFGKGLVETPNDFGKMGAAPTHPELLDWLAVTFRDDMGGSLKQLHRLIVTSATYRQASAGGNSLAEKMDAENSLLWRQNRRRLEAEALRDAVLAISGKLDRTMGGPGWQDFVIDRAEHSPHYEYGKANPDDPKTWRRSIYRFIVRSQTQPWMTALDCADPSIRVDRRNESLSALQALALLNNGFIVTQTRHFAERVQREAPDPEARIDRAYRLALGRSPTAPERERLAAFVEVNGFPNLCRVLLNLNEFTFVD